MVKYNFVASISTAVYLKKHLADEANLLHKFNYDFP